jgi:hypothetical protein
MEANTSNNYIGSPARLSRSEILRRRLFRKIPKPVVEKILDFVQKFQKVNPHWKFDADLPCDEAMLLFRDYCRSGASERTLG